MSKIWTGRTEFPPAITIEAPAHRLVCCRGSFKGAPKSGGQYNVHRIVQNHPFNRRVELMVPQPDPSGPAVPRPPAGMERVEYVEMVGPLVDIVDPLFVRRHMRAEDGADTPTEFVALSTGTPIDRTNVCAISGEKLRLTLDKATFEQLGMDARPTKMNHAKGHRFNVTVELMSKVYQAKGKIYERVRWCLAEPRIQDVTMQMARMHGSESASIRLPASCKKLSSKEARRRRDELRGIRVPTVEALLRGFRSDELADEQVHPAIYEWVGLVACRLSAALGCAETHAKKRSHREAFAPIFDMRLPYYGQERGAGAGVTCDSWHGLLPAGLPKGLLAHARDVVGRGEAPYAVLSAWGCIGAPTSWGDQEHGRFVTGETHDYTIVVLPGDEYLLFVATGSEDLFR